MLAVSKGVLKARMLEYFRRVEKTGEELVVTDNRVPVLKVTPLKTRHGPEELFKGIRGKIKLDEKVLLESTEDEWEDC